MTSPEGILQRALLDRQTDFNEIVREQRSSDSDLSLAQNVLAALMNEPQAAHWLATLAQNDRYLAEEYRHLSRFFHGAALSEIREYMGNDPRQPITLDRISGASVILFREAFLRYSLSPCLWDPIEVLHNMNPLQEYAEKGCDPEEALSRRYVFYHDTWDNPFRSRLCILHPLYEGATLAFILAIISGAVSGIAVHEYTEWRNRRKERKRREAVDVLTQLLFESRVRFELLPIERARNRRLLSWTQEDLAEHYLKEYLPTIRDFRRLRGAEVCAYYRGLYSECRELAEKLIPDA